MSWHMLPLVFGIGMAISWFVALVPMARLGWELFGARMDGEADDISWGSRGLPGKIIFTNRFPELNGYRIVLLWAAGFFVTFAIAAAISAEILGPTTR